MSGGTPRATSTLDGTVALLAWRDGAPAGDVPTARAALERARRTAPDNALVALGLGLARLRDGDPVAAALMFEEVTTRHDVAEAWLGLAASALQAGRTAQAASAMQACLSRHAANESAQHLAAAVAEASGQAGWCAVGGDGRLRAGAPADAVLDGVRLNLRWVAGSARLPPGRMVSVSRAGRALLGSPLDLAAIGAMEGFVEAHAGGLAGWAWHPGDPGRDPVITVAGATERRVTLRGMQPVTTAMRPLARPRRIALGAADLPAGVLRVTGADGRDLLGSPLDPGLEQRCAAGLAQGFQPIWADVVGPPCTMAPDDGPVDVVVPVYGGRVQALACLDGVLASLPPGSRLHVVDDASPDATLAASLDALAGQCRILLHRLPQNRGFPSAANAGLRAAAGRDVVLLNSDTVVPPGWLQALIAAARSAPGIATACPLSNDATILSYPDAEGGNPMPPAAATAALAALAARANRGAVVDIPVAVGFCMFIRRACLDQVGLFRDDLFAQGYGEENDFCLRARHAGWRHVAVPGAFVAHEGGASFGMARQHLQARNAAVLARLHPGYHELLAGWIAADPLGPARLRMDALRWRAGRRQAAVVLVTHAAGGGVDRVVDARVAAIAAAGQRPIVLRPAGEYVVVGDGGTPNLRYRMPGGLAALARLLRPERPRHVELHHMLGQHPALLGLAATLGVPQDVYVHDYAWFCPRIALVPARSYCGEPPLSGCEACIADHGAVIEEAIGVADLVDRSAALLGAARRVVAPSADVAVRMRRHFPAVQAEVHPWEDDAAIPPPAAPAAIARVCVVGAVGVEKGYEVLLGCLRDAVRRRLPLSFALVGHSSDDARLLDAGPIDITGRYEPAEVEALIRAQRADIAFLPSIWPETWCFTLGHAWAAGLRAAVFDLGSPAERVRRTGWGWVLPLGLPPAAINDWLLRFGAGRAPIQPAPPHTVRPGAAAQAPQAGASPALRNDAM